ncbi:hypothetical protein J6590_099215, partial [Homalodisca vitripennis]
MEINVLGMTLNCLSHPFPAPALIKECLLVSVLGLMCACDADASEVCSEQRCRSLCCYVRARVVREFPSRLNELTPGPGELGARPFLVFRPAPLHTKRWLTFSGYLLNSKAQCSKQRLRKNNQKFGHSSKVCQNKELCVQCGKEYHNEKTCNIEPFCVNCKGKHSAASRNCKIYLEEKEVIKIATVNKLSFVDARKEYRRRTAQLPKKDVSYAKAAASTTRDTPSCSHCSSLEAMVEALTQQMANFISLLSVNFNPIPQVQQKLLPAKTSDDPRLQSTRAKFLKTPNEKTNVSEKLKPQQQTPAKRKALNDKLKQSIKSKIDNRSQGSPKTSTHSRFSSQSSVMEEDEIVDEQTLETEFKTVT